MPKRIFDVISSISGLIILSPLILIISILVKTTSKGPIIYKGIRVGLHGKPFKMFKFRSMVENADKIGGSSTAGDDPRLTETGKFLRRHKLDEIPQLINVLKGDMSLVGPRPEVQYYVDTMTEEEKNTILSTKPGITDWASIWDLHEEEVLRGSNNPEKDYLEKILPEKIRLQIKYVNERTFFKDISIIFSTIFRVFKQPKRPEHTKKILKKSC
jgi:lipopolysaccharide/colanic/teichoic acid biosynthesis glycosyltransferase